MKRLNLAGCLIVLFFAFFSSISLAKDTSPFSTPELDQALEELEGVVVKSKPQSPSLTPAATTQNINLELLRHPEDFNNPYLKVTGAIKSLPNAR